jgi:transposase
LVEVGSYVGCSPSIVRKSLYAQLEIDVGRHLNYPWPKKLGIDEHGFGKNRRQNNRTEFNTVFTDIAKHRLYRVAFTKSSKKLFEQFKDNPGADKVEDVAIDLCEGFRSFCRALFPNARITADKFHVVRLLLPAINRRRKEIAGDRRKNPIGRLLLRSRKNLKFYQRSTVDRWLEPHPELKAIYEFKECMNELYRVRGRNRAEKSFDRMIEKLKGFSHIPELKTLHRTLTRWRTEILNYFDSKMTNAMTEGFNGKAKLLKKMGYGYRNQNNFGLRLLNACFH